MNRTSMILLVSLMLAIVAYLVFGHNGLLKYRELVGIKRQYENEISEMNNRIDELEKEIEMIKNDPAYLEMHIREELDVRGEGEDVYIVDNESLYRQPTD